MQLGREVSAATYLWDRRSELSLNGHGDAVLAAIKAGMALEGWELERARRQWRWVIDAAEQAGRAARRAGHGPRRLASEMGRVRESVELVLFDGRLPPDLAACSARTAAKMYGRVLERALAAYWDG